MLIGEPYISKRLYERIIFPMKSFSGKVGAISASSRYVIDRVMKLIDDRLDLVVEYGAGTGVMTKALLRKLSPNGKLIVIESDPQFVVMLKSIKDNRLQIIEGNIQDILLDSAHGFSNVNIVVSSIPFSFLTPPQRRQIILDTNKMIMAGGSFILFHQYRMVMLEPLKMNFRKVSLYFEPRNIFPSFILHAEK